LDDFRVDNLKISYHALQRGKERGIPLEELRRNKPTVATVVQVGKTLITTYAKSIQPNILQINGKRYTLQKYNARNQI
jgi:co-chaperonin GroES (HSP10)